MTPKASEVYTSKNSLIKNSFKLPMESTKLRTPSGDKCKYNIRKEEMKSPLKQSNNNLVWYATYDNWS